MEIKNKKGLNMVEETLLFSGFWFPVS